MHPALAICSAVAIAAAALAHYYGFKGRQFVIGVDLGTTFSVVAIKRTHDEGGDVEVIPDARNGKLLVPSVVAYVENDRKVGYDALPWRVTDPLHTVYNAKRFIGRGVQEVQEHAKEMAFGVDGNESAVWFDLKPHNVTPIDVGSAIVERLFESATKYMGYEPRGAVICVPATFVTAQVAATREAFERAGLKVHRIMDEPTAAAVAYNLHRSQAPRNVLVYDIGGGTTDVSLLFMNRGSVSVQGTRGDEHLGGSDFDIAVYELLAKKLPCAESVLRVEAEDAKKRLSDSSEVSVECDGSKIVVTREEFHLQAAELFGRAMLPVTDLLESLLMEPEGVDDVVLVGGASRTPRIRELLRNMFGHDRVHSDIDPDVTVAYGAANILD